MICYIPSRVGVVACLIRRALDWMIGFVDTLYTYLRTTGNYSAIADLHTLQCTVTHALGFSLFTSRILTTDLSQSHSHFISHMKSSFHGLIPFLPFFSQSHWTVIFRTLTQMNYSSTELSQLLTSTQTTLFVPLY
jgi:hypothetical protein